ncbi:FecCD family ABC transporter permease [Lactococcus termiticola]|uniref:Iron ABC transporter permease protein n=1 Tax=Lactococcus termiticola TaxID=2169526 RepID=A0A2R5HFD0_9LACT|nr:iron ABC transporter permease [Lactococcus termiticola]GBG96005.1 iron ABC transporter permease protein [Lactococcus termiticola]
MKKAFFLIIGLLMVLVLLDLTQFSTDVQLLSLLVPDFRLPRLLAVLGAGFALSLSGLILQSLTKNPLADGGTLGLTSGASFGAVAFLLILSKLHLTGFWSHAYPLFALLGSLLAFFLIYIFALKRQLSNTRLLLTGIALTALFQALITMGQLSINSFDFQQVATWLSGDVWQSDWAYLGLVYALLLIALAVYPFYLKRLEVLNLGDELALSLGLDLQRTKFQLYLLATAFAMIGVLLVGGLGFVGLIAPHIAGELTGFKLRAKSLMAGLVGMLILVFADLLSQLLIYPSSLPIGFLVAFIGAPYYIYLIQKKLS